MHGKGQNDFADTISRYFPDLIAILIFFQCISHSTRFSSIRRFDLGSIREKQLKAKRDYLDQLNNQSQQKRNG